MELRNRILIATLALGAIVVPVAGEAAVYVDINVAPPPPRVEVVPAPRVGYVWAPGYWNWNGHQHVWKSGYWVRERHGYHYAPNVWVQQNGHWHFVQGGWKR
jgi:WXXGXW repeat (2 copies)